MFCFLCTFPIWSQQNELRLEKETPAPVVDGEVSAQEWDKAAKVEINRSEDWKVIAQVQYNKDYLSVAVSNLEYEGKGRVNAEVLIHTSDPGSEWTQNTFWFHSSYSNCFSKGSYFEWENCDAKSKLWEANTFPFKDQNDNIEFVISFEQLEMDAPSKGDTLYIAIKLSDAKEMQSYWPEKANIKDPSTWGKILF